MGALLVTFKRLGFDLRQLLVVVALNVYITFQFPGISWQGHLGGLVVGAIVGAAMVYPPQQSRREWLWGSAIGVLVVLAALVIIRDGQIGEWFCVYTPTATAAACRRTETGSSGPCRRRRTPQRRPALPTGSAPRSVRPKTSRSSSTRSISMVVLAIPSRLRGRRVQAADLRPRHHPGPAEAADQQAARATDQPSAPGPGGPRPAPPAMTTPTTRSIGSTASSSTQPSTANDGRAADHRAARVAAARSCDRARESRIRAHRSAAPGQVVHRTCPHWG